MKWFLQAVLFMLVSMPVAAQSRDDPPEPTGASVQVFVQYHIWYATAHCAPGVDSRGHWNHWTWTSQDDPCQTVPGAPWLREISSPGYPLIGPYRSVDPEVMRWHIRLAKAAGIDGFFVSVYSWVDPRAFDAFATMLHVAWQEDFKLGIEAWMPDPDYPETWKSEVIRQLDVFTVQSPDRNAFLRIAGHPAYWFAYRDWMQADEFRTFLDSRSATWILGSGRDVPDLVALNRSLVNSSVQQFSDFNGPTSKGWQFSTDFSTVLARARAQGLIPLSHGYPGFDESRLGRTTNRFGTRSDGRTLHELLESSLVYGAKMVLIESFNDWNEYTMIEPGVDTIALRNDGQEVVFAGDPYRYLKIIAAFREKDWVAPVPSCAIIDPLLASRGIACN